MGLVDALEPQMLVKKGGNMKLPTKTITSLLVVTAVAAAVPGISQIGRRRQKAVSQFDRLIQRHDRKGELRAEVLNMTPEVFRDAMRRMPFDRICRQAGFATVRAYRLALLGRLRYELHHRGWTAQQINSYVLTRSDRIG